MSCCFEITYLKSILFQKIHKMSQVNTSGCYPNQPSHGRYSSQPEGIYLMQTMHDTTGMDNGQDVEKHNTPTTYKQNILKNCKISTTSHCILRWWLQCSVHTESFINFEKQKGAPLKSMNLHYVVSTQTMFHIKQVFQQKDTVAFGRPQG